MDREPSRRYVVEWRVMVTTRLDGRRPLTLSAMARTADAARDAATAAAPAALEGEVRVSVSSADRAVRRSAVHCDAAELERWDPSAEAMPASMRGSRWAAAVARDGARAAFGSLLREAASLARAAKLLDRATAARLVDAGEEALEGRGALSAAGVTAVPEPPGGSPSA